MLSTFLKNKVKQRRTSNEPQNLAVKRFKPAFSLLSSDPVLVDGNSDVSELQGTSSQSQDNWDWSDEDSNDAGVTRSERKP